ncbi:uncharacterized protein LOC124149681 [Haliotis rufescens]|uniref:uncharacterized protein LOC124149681 n=1 Tax=Haliotis rufescens TaxID=6454 RepID=UPI00201E7517|nr:uncharacterized protein LOC124149681 [Haliotis rufescens]
MHLKVIILVLYLWANSELGTSELTCPSQSEVGSTADITCIAPNTTDKHGYSTPNKEVAAICQTNRSSCQTLGDYSAAVINDTCSVLTIPSVKLSDAGDWRCTVSPSPMLTCHMVVYTHPVKLKRLRLRYSMLKIALIIISGHMLILIHSMKMPDHASEGDNPRPISVGKLRTWYF